MSKKKGKFDFTNVAHHCGIHEGDTLFFVGDPSKSCRVVKLPNGEYKVSPKAGKIETVHAFVVECLGMEPQNHVAQWLRTKDNKTLYDLWQEDLAKDAA